MSDRIAVMFEGQIAQLASPQQLYRRPVNRKVAEFIGVMNFMPAVVSSVGDRIEMDVSGFGRVTIPAEQCPGGAKTGEASVGFRPETVTILFDGDQAKGRTVPGVVEEVEYFGDMTYYVVKLTGVEKPVTISMRNLVGRKVLERGDKTVIAWEEGSLVLFC